MTDSEIATLGSNAARLAHIRGKPAPGSPTPARITRRWMGVVKAVDGDGRFFDAQLTPVDQVGPDIDATLSRDAVVDDDAPLLAPGASFYLYAGRTHLGPGRTVAFTSIMVRRLGRWRDEEVEFLQERALKSQSNIDFT